MNYYKLLEDTYYPNRWYLGDVNIDDNFIFSVGDPANMPPDQSLTVGVNQAGVALDYTLTDAYIVPIISTAFVECLAECMNDVQLFPLSIPNVQNSYYILGVKNRIHCLDDAHCDFQTTNLLRVDASKITKSIFRIAHYDIDIIISEALKTRLEKSKLTALKFELVS